MHDPDATNPLIGRPGQIGPDSDATVSDALAGGQGPPTQTNPALRVIAQPVIAQPVIGRSGATTDRSRARFARRRGTLLVGIVAFGFLIGTAVAVATSGGETRVRTKPVAVPNTVASVASSTPTTRAAATTTTTAAGVSVEPVPGTIVVLPTVPTTADTTTTTAPPPPPPDPASG